MPPEKIDEYYAALAVCAERYFMIATIDSLLHEEHSVIPFISTFIQGIDDRLPLMKLTTVVEERNFTRPLFRHLDFD
jgi:hypothetical protein